MKLLWPMHLRTLNWQTLRPLTTFLIVVFAGVGETTTCRGDQAGLPAVAWPSSPIEVTVAFTAPVPPAIAATLVGQPISYHELKSDIRPAARSSAPQRSLRIAGVCQADDGKTLILATDPHPRLARYQIQLPSRDARQCLLEYDLSGVELHWNSADDPERDPSWDGWLPELDLDVGRAATAGSAQHDRLWSLLSRNGQLTLSTMVRVPEQATAFVLESDLPILEATFGEQTHDEPQPPDPTERYRVEFDVAADNGWLFLMVVLETGGGHQPPTLRARFRRADQETLEPVRRERLTLPWAPIEREGQASVSEFPIPRLQGGDPDRGATVFASEQARCAQCHVYRGRGHAIGPDLDRTAAQGPESIYRSITAPSESIEPEYLPYSVATRDGRVFVGLIRAEGPTAIRLTDSNATSILIDRSEIEQLRPSMNSIMPVGLAASLGEDQIRDLIAYLCLDGDSAVQSPIPRQQPPNPSSHDLEKGTSR